MTRSYDGVFHPSFVCLFVCVLSTQVHTNECVFVMTFSHPSSLGHSPQSLLCFAICKACKKHNTSGHPPFLCFASLFQTLREAQHEHPIFLAFQTRSEMTLNYRVMVEGYPNLKEEVGGSNPGCEISSLLDGKLTRWSIASCVWRWPVGLLSHKRKNGRSKISNTRNF